MWTPAENNVITTLASAVGPTDTTISLTDASDFPQAGVAVLGGGADPLVNEVVAYTSKSGNDLTGVTRGQDGTTAEAHTSGASTALTIVAQHIKELQVTYGTTASRTALGALLTTDDVGRRWFDTSVDELFVWMGSQWAIPLLVYGGQHAPREFFSETPAESAAILAGSYQKGDRWTDISGTFVKYRICRVDVVTNTLADWTSIGAMN